MRIGKDKEKKFKSSVIIQEDFIWRGLLNSLADSCSLSLMETHREKITFLSPLAAEMLDIKDPTAAIEISRIFIDNSKLKRLKENQSLIVNTIQTNTPVPLTLIKNLSDRKKLFVLGESIAIRSSGNNEPGSTALYSNEAFMNLVLHSSPMVYYSYNPSQHEEIWYSEQIEQLTGFTIQDFKNTPGLWVSRVYPEDYQQLSDKFDHFVPNVHISCEYRWLDAKDRIIWIFDQAALVKNPETQIWQIVGCFRNITDQKEAEFALFESERNYREIFNSSNEAIFIHDPKTGKVVDVNDTMLKMYKTTYENALTKDLMHFSDGRPPYDAEHAKQNIEKAIRLKDGHHFTWLAHRDDQSAFWAEVTLKPITISGEMKVMAGVRNIDEKKRADEQIKYQNDFEKLILDISTNFINIPYDKVDHEIEASIKKICHFTNTDAGHIFLHDKADQSISLHYLWQRKPMNFNFKQLQQIKDETNLWYINNMKKGEAVLLENIDNIPDEDSDIKSRITDQGVYSLIDVPLFYQNDFIGSFGIAVSKTGRKWLPYEVSLLKLTGQIFVNVIKRKESVQRLLESEEKYRHLVENQTDLIIKMNPEGLILFVSSSFSEIFEVSEEDLLGKEFTSLLHKDDQEDMLKKLNSLLHPPYASYTEQRILTRKGWCWIAWNNKAILNENKEVIEILAVGRDITYQKGVEDAMRRSEDRFRSIVQHSSDIIFIVDKEGIILYETPTVKKILGYEEGALIGTRGVDLMHPDELEFVISYLKNIINNNVSASSIELRLKHADNRWIPLEGFAINMLNYPSISGIVVTLRDISERKLTEKKILDAVIRTEEQERERFAKNLHDDLGPLLSSIKMYVNSLNTGNNPEKQDYIITQLNEVVKEAIQTTKDVSNDLSPHILQNYGLVSAIDSFFHKVPSSIKISFSNSLSSERYSIAIENSMYRIIKELINNTLKHAEASEIKLLIEEQGNILSLQYSDNGKGFVMKNNQPASGRGMGLSNIISRVRSLNGNYEFQTSPNEGFLFKFNIPIHQLME